MQRVAQNQHSIIRNDVRTLSFIDGALQKQNKSSILVYRACKHNMNVYQYTINILCLQKRSNDIMLTTTISVLVRVSRDDGLVLITLRIEQY